MLQTIVERVGEVCVERVGEVCDERCQYFPLRCTYVLLAYSRERTVGEKGEGVVFSRPLKGPLSPLYTVVGPVNLQSAVIAPV